jgi:hypothetical protein
MKRVTQFALGALLALASIEAGLQLLPVSSATNTGYYIDPLILTYPAHHEFTVSTGWDLKNGRSHRSNNFGFVDTRDFSPDPNAVALIGDSFVEANMLAEQDRLGAVLERQLGRPVYSLGAPGTSLFDYLTRARFAAEHFGIRRFVFLIERGDMRQVLCGSGNNHGQCYDARADRMVRVPDHEISAIKAVARHSALAQYLFSQLKINPSSWRGAPISAHAALGRRTAIEDPVADDVARRIVERFIAGLPTGAAPPLLLIDARRERHTQTDEWNDHHMSMLADAASTSGWKVVDLTSTFNAWRQRTGLAIEVGPFDAHWNREGHHLAAHAAARALPPDWHLH